LRNLTPLMRVGLRRTRSALCLMESHWGGVPIVSWEIPKSMGQVRTTEGTRGDPRLDRPGFEGGESPNTRF